LGVACCALATGGGCIVPGHWGNKKSDSLAAAPADVKSPESLALQTSSANPVRQTNFSGVSQSATAADLNGSTLLEPLPEAPASNLKQFTESINSDAETFQQSIDFNASTPITQTSNSTKTVNPFHSLSWGSTVSASHASLDPRDASQSLENLRDLSDTEMISLALANSPILRPLGVRVIDQPGAATTVYDRCITATDPFYGPQAALAQFDSQLLASLDNQNNDRVFNNTTLGGNIQELTQDFANLNLGVQKRTLSGATVGLNSITAYDNNNRQGNIFPSYWERQLEASIRQPLARGAGRQYNEIAGPNATPGFNFSNGIVIARLNTQISDAEFQVALRKFVSDLYVVYWELSSQYDNYESINRAADVAYKTWQTTLAKREASLEGGEANREAESRARFYRYRRELQLALGGPNGLYVTERRLRQLMGVPIVDGSIYRPSVAPSVAPVRFDFDTLVAEAMTKRVELQRQSIRVQQQQFRLVASKNFLLPQVDAIGRYRMRGFGDDLYGDGQRFTSANQDLFSLDHQEWQFGVEMGMTVGRRQAQAAVQNATLQLHRERAILLEQQREIRHEVSDAYAAVLSAFTAFETSQAQVDAARERFESSQALFEGDKLQIEFLLDAQAELRQAEQFRIADQAQYANSLVQVGNATGTLLREAGVDCLAAAY
jgi:outer membrane protein TolC